METKVSYKDYQIVISPVRQTTLLACDLLMGHDEFSMGWIKAYRKRSAK